MPRDYARSRPRQQSSGGPAGIVWLLTGILIGLIIAGIFYVKNQQHAKPPVLGVPAVAVPAKTAADLPVAQLEPAKPTSTQNLQTQFDFYNVLPSKKVIGPSGDEDTTEIQNGQNDQLQIQPTAASPPVQQQAPATAPIQAIPASKPKPVSPSSPGSTKAGTYIVQVAALSEASDADQLKAQLTLLGFDVKVTTSTPKNGKTYHRVWLGAFHTLSEAESIQKQLQENMISSKVLKSMP